MTSPATTKVLRPSSPTTVSVCPILNFASSMSCPHFGAGLSAMPGLAQDALGVGGRAEDGQRQALFGHDREDVAAEPVGVLIGKEDGRVHLVEDRGEAAIPDEEGVGGEAGRLHHR